MAIPPSISPYLTTAETAQRLRVSVRTVERLNAKGKLTAYYIGGRGHRRFRTDDVECLLVPDYFGGQQDADLDSFISTHSKKG